MSDSQDITITISATTKDKADFVAKQLGVSTESLLADYASGMVSDKAEQWGRRFEDIQNLDSWTLDALCKAVKDRGSRMHDLSAQDFFCLLRTTKSFAPA